MTESEKLRKEMEKKGLLGTDTKKATVITNTATDTKKQAEKTSASSLRSRGETVDVVKDTGLGSALKKLKEKREAAAKKATVKINTDSAFKKNNTTVNPIWGREDNGADLTKSTATDEKTRLYETNDSLLTGKELLQKYSYVVQDEEMDKETLQRAAKKGMTAIGKAIKESPDMDTYKEVAKLQTELQSKLSSASFAAGLIDALGGDVASIAAKASGNEQLQEQNSAMQALLQQTKEENNAAGTAGALLGEMTKAGAGYMTIGKAAEQAALKGAGKLTGGKALSKGGEIATRLLGQQVADTVVNTPITVAAGLADDKTKEEIAKDVGEQVALDAAFNVGLEGLGAVGRAAGRALSKAKKVQMDDSVNKISRLSDQELLDQKAIVHHLKKNGVPVNADNTVTLYHVTSPDNAKKIRENGFVGTNAPVGGMTGEELKPRSFFGLDKDWTKQWDSGGYEMIEIRVPAQYVRQGAQNANEVYIEGNIRHIGNGIWEPDTYPTSTFYDRRAVKRYQKDLGDNSVQKEASNVASEKTGKVNETATKQALTEADLPELAKEYQLKSSSRYYQEQSRQWAEKYGEGTEAYLQEEAKYLQEMEELQEMLGIRTNKVQATESRIKNAAVRNAKKSMSIFGQADNAEAKKLMQRAIREANRGKVTEKTRNEIFEKLFALGKESNSGSIDKGLKDRLKSLKLQISEADAANIADFNLWKKGTMGKIGSITKAERGNIDTTWNELRNDWPEWFPADIVHPADQLQRIAEVADEMKYYNIPISETMAKEEKALLREGFDRFMDELENETAKLTRFTKEKEEKQLRKLLNRGAMPDYSRLSTKDVEYMHDELYRLQNEYARVERKVNLTAGDKSDLERLLRGEITEAQARERAGANADDLIAMYEVSLPLNRMKGSLEGYRQYVNGRYSDEMKDNIGEMAMRAEGKDGWQDIAMLRQARETQSRIVDLVAPKKIAAWIKENIFDPIHTSERDRTLFKNKYIDTLKETKISTKKDILIRMGDGTSGTTSESALVQWLGEKRYQLLEMERKKGHATADDLQAELMLRSEIQAVEANLNAEQLKKIDNCIDKITKIYKEIHPKINETLIRNGYAPIGYIEGYFPHMNFDDPKGIGEKAASLLGFDFTSKELPMDIAGRTDTFRPGKKWAGNLLTRTGQQTDYDALRAFDLYIDNISDVIYHTDNIKRLRAYEDHIRYTLSDKGIQEAVDRIRQNPHLDEVEKTALIETEYAKNQEHTLQNYVNNIRLYTDLLAGKKHNADRIMENYVIGRKVYKVIDSIESKVAGNMVAGNVGSAMTNMIPITQGMASMSAKSNLQGLKEALVYMGSREMDDLTKKSAFLTTREGSDLLYKTGVRKASEVGGKLNPLNWMEVADTFSTQAVWRSRYYDNMAKGMTEDAAIRNADEFARNLFGGRSKGAMPTAFHSKTLKPLTMFQLEVNNQLSYLAKDVPKDAQGDLRKVFKTYMGIAIGAYIFNDVYEKMTGRRSALDPFGMANEAIGDYTGEKLRNIVDISWDAATGEGVQLTEKTEKKKASVATEELMTNVGSNLPFIGGIAFDGGRIPMKSAIPHPIQAVGTAFDLWQGETTPEKAGRDIYSDLSPALWYGLMPTAGGQIRKSLHGVNTMAKGGRYNQTNDGAELQFAVDQDSPANWVQSLLFGQWATEGGKAYNEDNSTKLGTSQTDTYEKLVAAGAKNTLAFDEINKIRAKSKSAEKRAAIRSSLLNEEQKAILYYDLVAGETDKEILDGFQKMGSMGTAADCLSRMAEHEGTSAKRTVLRGSDLSDYEKEYIYLNKIITTDDSREKEKAKIDALKAAGIGMNDYLTIKNKYAYIEDNVSKTKERAAQMSSWLIEQGYSSAQQAAIKEQFAFWGMYKQQYK